MTGSPVNTKADRASQRSVTQGKLRLREGTRVLEFQLLREAPANLRLELRCGALATDALGCLRLAAAGPLLGVCGTEQAALSSQRRDQGAPWGRWLLAPLRLHRPSKLQHFMLKQGLHLATSRCSISSFNAKPHLRPGSQTKGGGWGEGPEPGPG